MSRVLLLPGDEVLDLCCGAGASAIPAARTVTTTGHVVAVDVAQPLLDAARARAADEGLANLEFRLGDARRTGLPDSSFDAVICVFGVFFASDMVAFVSEMWRLVRPGETLAITTWGAGLFEPADRLFWETVALGTGYRATVDALEPEQRRVLRSKLLARLRDEGIATVRTDVVYGVARRG